MSEVKPVDIILVEDNPDDEELALLALHQNNLGNRIIVLRDGAEAVAYLLGPDVPRPRPRLILLDLKLPKIDGLEVLRRLKADERTRVIPVVMLTSSREERDLIESYRLGVNSYIVKPVDFDQFSQSVRQIGLYWLVLNEQPVDDASNDGN
jgi:two-component system response regulator